LGLALSGQKRRAEAALAFASCREALRCIREDPLAQQRFRAQLDREIQELRAGLAGIERDRLKKTAIPWQEMNGAAPPNLGQSTQAVHALEERLSALQKLRQNPEREPAAVGIALGNAHFLAGDLALAEEGFRSALQVERDNADAHHNLGLVLMLLDRLDEAESHLKAARKAGLALSPRIEEEMKQRRAAAARPPG
jgi:tetratricopeptide (TPR) repeat protein